MAGPRPFGFVGLDPREEAEDPYLAELRALQEEEFQPEQYSGGSFFEPFAGLESQDLRRPTSFGEGFLGGLSSGIGSLGTRQLTARQKFEQAEAERRKAFDVDRRIASRQLREMSGAERRRRDSEEKETRKAREKYLQDTVALKPGDSEHLFRIADAEGRVPRNFMADATKPQKAEKERTIEVKLSDGSVRYMTESEARGLPPQRPPTESKDKPSTGEEKKMLGYYQLAKDAESTIAAANADNVDPKRVIAAIELPFGMGQAALNDDERAYLQALRQFTEARLRPASGATITPPELRKDFQTFFKQPGDTKADLDRKAKSRAVLLGGLQFQSGRAYREYYGEEAPKGSAQSRTKKPKPSNIVRQPKPQGKQLDDEYEQMLRMQGNR